MVLSRINYHDFLRFMFFCHEDFVVTLLFSQLTIFGVWRFWFVLAYNMTIYHNQDCDWIFTFKALTAMPQLLFMYVISR